jgi:hypothetical protein
VTHHESDCDMHVTHHESALAEAGRGCGSARAFSFLGAVAAVEGGGGEATEKRWGK